MNLEEIKQEFLKGITSWKAAKILLREVFVEDAISRAYYAVLHSAKAVLLSEEIEVKSHRAIRRLFGQKLIQYDKIDKKYARILNTLQDCRIQSDYNSIYNASKEEAQDLVFQAMEFINEMKIFLKEKGIEIIEENLSL